MIADSAPQITFSATNKSAPLDGGAFAFGGVGERAVDLRGGPMFHLVRLVLLTLILAACEGLSVVASSDGASPSPDATTSTPICMTNADCDDHIACTLDECLRSSSRRFPCAHSVQPSRCEAGQTCDARRGCIPGRVCTGDGDCRDMDQCTVNERCDLASRVCIYDLFDGDEDGEPARACGGMDCNDANPEVLPGAAELCDRVDNNCDGRVDELTPNCGRGTVCRNGVCECENTLVGFRSCRRGSTTICPDTRSDDQACGIECTPCSPGTHCMNSRCQCETAGAMLCAGACIDTLRNITNCGVCGRRCSSDAAGCEGGRCVCPAGRTSCVDVTPTTTTEVCADLMSSHDHCGRCETACAPTQICRNGQCECPAGQTGCPFLTRLPGGREELVTTCFDLTRDPNHCGACDRFCQHANPPQECRAGECVTL